MILCAGAYRPGLLARLVEAARRHDASILGVEILESDPFRLRVEFDAAGQLVVDDLGQDGWLVE